MKLVMMIGTASMLFLSSYPAMAAAIPTNVVQDNDVAIISVVDHGTGMQDERAAVPSPDLFSTPRFNLEVEKDYVLHRRDTGKPTQWAGTAKEL